MISQQLFRLGSRNRRVLGELGVDGRSARGRALKQLTRELVAHVGGKPSVTQRLLIERAVQMRAQLVELDAKLAKGETWSVLDTRTYSALGNSYRNTLCKLGLDSADSKTVERPSLTELVGQHKTKTSIGK